MKSETETVFEALSGDIYCIDLGQKSDCESKKLPTETSCQLNSPSPAAGTYFPKIRLLMALVTKISHFHEMFSCELTSLSSYSSMLFIIYYVTLT